MFLTLLLALDDIGVCQLISVYTLIACWIIPAICEPRIICLQSNVATHLGKIVVFYSIYFAVVVYLQSRIPVVVEPKPQKRRSRDLEMGSADSLAWANGRMPETVKLQGSDSDASGPSGSLGLPAVVRARQSLPQSRRWPTFPEPLRGQLTMPSLPHTGHQPFHSVPSIASRHRSLPALKHNSRADLRPLLTSCPSASTSTPQTPSSYSYSTPSLMNAQSQSFSFGPSAADVPSSGKGTRYTSMMPFSSSPREIESAKGTPTTPRSTRARLSKPVPAHLM